MPYCPLKNIQEMSNETSLISMTANKQSTSQPNNTVQPQYNGQNNRGRGRNKFNRRKGRGNFNNRGAYNGGGNFNKKKLQTLKSNFNNHHHLTCHICYKHGRIALDYYQRMSYIYQRSQSPAKLVVIDLAASNPYSQPPPTWHA